MILRHASAALLVTIGLALVVKFLNTVVDVLFIPLVWTTVTVLLITLVVEAHSRRYH